MRGGSGVFLEEGVLMIVWYHYGNHGSTTAVFGVNAVVVPSFTRQLPLPGSELPNRTVGRFTTTTEGAIPPLVSLVDEEYKFTWVDVGSASDTQVFNNSELKDAIGNGSTVVPKQSPYLVMTKTYRISSVHITPSFRGPDY